MNLIVFVIVVVIIVAYQMMRKQPMQPEQLKQAPTNSAKVKIRLFMSNYTQQSLRARPDSLFLFGDNLDHAGSKGQAVIRHEPNAAGIVTKLKPFMNEDSFMRDDDYESNCQIIDDSFDAVYKRLALKTSSGELYKTLYIPVHGLGTGLAQLPQRAPRTFIYMMGKLYDLVADYDPDQLTGSIGQWIKNQSEIIHNIS